MLWDWNCQLNTATCLVFHSFFHLHFIWCFQHSLDLWCVKFLLGFSVLSPKFVFIYPLGGSLAWTCFDIFWVIGGVLLEIFLFGLEVRLREGGLSQLLVERISYLLEASYWGFYCCLVMFAFAKVLLKALFLMVNSCFEETRYYVMTSQ